MDPSMFFQAPSYQEDHEADDGLLKPRRRYFPDTYLDSPIMVTTRTRWLTALSLYTAETKSDTQFDRTVRDVVGLLNNPLDYEIVDPEEYSDMYRYAWPSTLGESAHHAWHTAMSIYKDTNSVVEQSLGARLSPLPEQLSESALFWLHRWSYWDSLVEEFSKQSASTGNNVAVIRLGGHTRLVATKDVWFVDLKTKSKYMLLYDQVLMIKDALYSRAQCYVTIDLRYSSTPEMARAAGDLFEWQEDCLKRYGNHGYEIVSKSEAMAKAYLSEMSDVVFGSDGPYRRMIAKIIDKERKLHATAPFQANLFDSFIRRCKDIQTVVEVFGMQKMSGHPLIDARVGGVSAAAEARSADQTLFHDAHMLDWEFKRVMLESYIKRHGSWPPLHFTTAGKTTELHRYYRMQFRGLHRGCYPMSDWAECRFGQIVEFDYSPNYLDLIDDKSISLYRSNIAATWKKDIKPKSHRRLLIELINREVLDIRAIVQLVVRREVPFDWFIVSLHPKEREFKIAPRMFSMLVLEIRIFFALSEANLADRIFPFLPQQTMTKSKIAIARQFLEITRPHDSTHSLRLFIEIDLSRWNLRWRGMSVNPIGRTLNDMFGVVGIFDFVHEFFSKSLILVRVNDLEPDGVTDDHPPESDLLWYNHLGGFEGICQKLWTVCTYSMISIAITDLPLSYVLLGQGDNQILSVVTTRDPYRSEYEQLSQLRTEITSRVSRTCASVNQEVKPEECLESTSVITYSKDIYVNGVYRPTTIKAHSRLFPHSSQIFPSVRTNLGAIFSTAAAGAENSTEPMMSYFCACLYGALYLYRTADGRGPYGSQLSYARRTLGRRFHEFVTFMLTLPSEAGGYPVIPYLGFTYKGGSDPLGKSLAAMNMLGTHSTGPNGRLFNRMLAQLSQASIYNPDPKPASLFLDPFSIPLMKPPTAVDGVAAETITTLAPVVKTTEIKDLMGADVSRYMDDLVEAMAGCSPMNPLIMRDILDCSLVGVTETVSKMFVATRTLQSVVRELGVPVVDKVLALEARGIAYMYNRFSDLPNDKATLMSTYALTSACRSRWKLSTPIVGVTTYMPTDFKFSHGDKSLREPGCNSVLTTTTDPVSTRGPYDPYVGSKTREKRSEHGFKIAGTDAASRAMRKLQLIASQTGDDPIFKALVDAVGWTRTNTTLSEVSHLLPGHSGGTLSHRYAARAGHQDAFNLGSPNFMTHLVISTDNMGPISGGMYDYPIMLQEQVLYLNWCMQTFYLHHRPPSLIGTLALGDIDLEPLPSVTIRGPDRLELSVVRFPHNPLAFLPDLKLIRVSGAIVHPSLDASTSLDPSSELRRHVLEAYFKRILRRSGAGRQISDGSAQHFTTACLDIAEAYSNGLEAVTDAIASVACDEAISSFMLTDLVNVTRWKVGVYASKVTKEMCKAVSPLVGHPMLTDDPVVRRLSLYDLPSYSGSRGTIHDRLSAYAMSKCHARLSGSIPSYNHRTVGLFSSDDSRALSEALFSCLLGDLYLWRIRKMVSSKLLKLVVQEKLISTIRAQHQEEDKVDTLIRITARLAQSTRLKDPEVNTTLLKFKGSRVKGYKAGIDDVLKATRQIDLWGMPAKYDENLLPVVRGTKRLPNARPFHLVHMPGSIKGYRPLPNDDKTQLDILRTTYLRNRGHRSVYGGTSLAIWSNFSPLLSSGVIIVIGSGMGSVARVALDSGATYVFGLDLRSTIPMRSHRFRHYKPPLVMASRYKDKYLQLPLSFSTSGDWTDEYVARGVLEYDHGTATIVIDIQSSSHRYDLSIIGPTLLRVKKAGCIIIRLYVTDHELGLLMADLVASGWRASAYDAYRDMYGIQAIIVIDRWNSDPRVAVSPEFDIPIPTAPTQLSVDQSHPDTEASVMSDCLYNVVYMSPGSTLKAAQDNIARLLDEAWGDYDSRYSYVDWARRLKAKVITDWWCASTDRWELLERWLVDGGTTITTTKGHRTWVTLTWADCYHIASRASRLL